MNNISFSPDPITINKPLLIIHYHNNATQLEHTLPSNSHFIQKQNELIKVIEQSPFAIREATMFIDTISHFNSTIRYICKLQFVGSGMPAYSNTKESDHPVELAVTILNDAVRYLRDQKDKIDNRG